MRITNSMMVNHFLYNLDSSLKKMDTLQAQMSTGMKFIHPSDDPAGAARSLQIRRNLSRIQQYQTNIRDAQAWLSETETGLMQIKDIAQNAYELTVQGANGTLAESDRKAVAQAIQNLQGELVLTGNANLAGKYLFGGENTQKPPFEVKDGKLLYNGVDLDSMDASTGLKDEKVVYDIGTGTVTDSSGHPISAGENVAFPGCNIIGFGKDEKGMPNSLYSILGGIREALENGENVGEKLQPLMGKLQENSEDILTQLTNVGRRTEYFEFMQSRMDSAQLNYTTRQSEIEDVDMAQAITDFKMKETVYRSALSVGARIIQPSLVDFLR